METAAQIEGARIQKEASTSGANGKECLRSAFAKPQYAEIKTKTYFSVEDRDWPLQTLNDDSLPTKGQIKQLYALYADIQTCRKIILDGANKIHPALTLAWVQNFSESDKYWADFTGGKNKMTWGQFNQGLKGAGVDGQARLTQAAAQIDGHLQAGHRYEMEQRRKAAEAMSELAVQQQAILAANRPRMTSCNISGNTALCSSF
jgi:hypothetical protein